MTSRHNVTSLVDLTLTLQCPLAAARRRSSRVTWQKRHDDGSWRSIARDGDRVRVRSGDLQFDRLLVSDAGFYRCFKTTIRGINYSEPVVLIVHGITVALSTTAFVVWTCLVSQAVQQFSQHTSSAIVLYAGCSTSVTRSTPFLLTSANASAHFLPERNVLTFGYLSKSVYRLSVCNVRPPYGVTVT